MTVEKSPSRFAKLREGLSYRLHLLPWKSVLLLVAFAGVLFWLRFEAPGLEQRLPPSLRFIVHPPTFEFLLVLFLGGWSLQFLMGNEYRSVKYEVKFPARRKKKKLGKKKEEETIPSSNQAPPGRTKSAPPQPEYIEMLPIAAEEPQVVLSESEPEFAVVRVFYATDRQATGQEVPSRFYGKKQSPQGMLSVGTCEVSIPRDHRIGELEHPSIWRFEFRENPEKHVVLLRVNPQSEDSYWADARNRVGGSKKKEAFVFVHGYNTTFEDAARRTAQLAYDLTFEGAAIFYSWPSYGELADYAKDENNVYWTVPHLKDFLAALAAQTEAETIHLIAHSMGNRAVSYALQLLAREVDHTPCRMRHLVLTAPDIDANTFKELAKDVKSVSDRVTLYVSPFDKALALSKRFHGNPRLGETIFVIPGIDTIDASSVDTSLIGHGYYAENTSVLTDIFYLLKDDKAPRDRFGMRPVARPDGTYYEFRPTNR